MALTQVWWKSPQRLTLRISRSQYYWERPTSTGDKLHESLTNWDKRFLETHIITSEKIVIPLVMHSLRHCWAKKFQVTLIEWPSWVECSWMLTILSGWDHMIQNSKLHLKSKSWRNKMCSKVNPKESPLADSGSVFLILISIIFVRLLA